MPGSLRIALLSDVEWSGGAAVAASRLARGLVTQGHELMRLVHLPNRRDSAWSIHTLAGMHSGRSLFAGAFARGGAAARLLRAGVAVQLDRALTRLRPDIINIHNLHSAGWHPQLAAVCAGHAPTVWTLHDMWSFTGRCAYNFDCRRFESGCDSSCPTPDEYPALAPARIAGAWQARRQLLDAHPSICAVAPSRWLQAEALRGLWAGHRVERIPYGVPLDTFRPHDAAAARARLALQDDRPVLLMAAADLTERRKGAALLLDALAQLERPVTLLTLGDGRLADAPRDVHVHHLGVIRNESELAQIYSAADLFVHPAPVDNLPNVVLESLASGTPVVGFPIGGVPDMVRAGVTGWLADSVSAPALAAALRHALDSIAGGVDLRRSCRSIAVDEYGMELQAERYTSLFESLRDSSPVASR